MGTNRDEVYAYVNTLALFLHEHEKKMSALHSRDGYVPGYQLQGFIGSKPVNDFPLIQNEMPSTIIGT